jgi:uncharacterized protein (DUF2267 family)
LVPATAGYPLSPTDRKDRKEDALNRDELVRQVRELAGVESDEEAERAIRATFETLRERLAGNEPRNLGSQVPAPLREPLMGEGGRDDFSLAEFYNRVAEREGVGEEEAGVHARAAATTPEAAVTPGEMDDVRHQLKPEYTELFGQQTG